MPGVLELVTLIQCLQIPSKTQYMFKKLKQIHNSLRGIFPSSDSHFQCGRHYSHNPLKLFISN